MKASKLLEQLKDYLDSERRAQIAKSDSIKVVLKKLKKKANSLKARLNEEADDAVREQLKREIEVITAQRKKGISLLKEIKKAQKNSDS